MLKIKTIKAATLYYHNAGVRSHFDYINAVVGDSLFLDFLLKHGMKVWKNSSTRDIICMDFSFGVKKTETEDGHKCEALSKDKLREYYYEHGATVTYPEETITYRMAYRNASKAKVGQVMFIREELFSIAHEWLNMGLPRTKIVEQSAYAPLTASTIVDAVHIPVDDVLILKDQDSQFMTKVKVVAEENGHCVVKDDVRTVSNTVWDGMALIDDELCEAQGGINGMVLLRNHFFKACAFRTKMRQFFADNCGENWEDVEVTDMFGVSHKLRDVKMITTDNAIKWKKFMDVMGDNPYEYWKDRVRKDGERWGIVKTDHPSKLGDVQQMSYQMVNTLPCDSNDIFALADTSVQYVELLKRNEDEFVKFLRFNANLMNHYDMMADLYEHNHYFAQSKWFRQEKTKIINKYVGHLKSGKVTVSGDNLTLAGNPYALLLYCVGKDWENGDITLQHEDGAIQCYTSRFRDGAYLCGIRNPQNSPNNICYLHNHYHEYFDRYFSFSPNILVVNCIHTDIQDRANGCDFDSDFFFVSDNPVMVNAAEKCYHEYPTIVNMIPESGITYGSSPADYAKMDNIFAKSQLAIGESSNLAQLAMTYYWTEPCEEYYNIFVSLSVMAQIAIDSVKRLYAVDPTAEIDAVKKMPCMQKYKGKDFPEFMRYIRKVQTVKNNKPVPQEEVRKQREKITDRINLELDCPMNGLITALSCIQRMPTQTNIPTEHFLLRLQGKSDSRQLGKVRKIVENFSYQVYLISHDTTLDKGEKYTLMEQLYDEILEKVGGIKLSQKTLNRLIWTAFGYGNTKSTTLLRVLYHSNRESFLKNFKNAEQCISQGI